MLLIEKYLYAVRKSGLNTKKAVDFSGAPSVALPSNTTVNGSPISGGGGATVPFALSGTDANALAVGQNGATNPAFNIDTSTASSATGLNIKSAAAAGGVAVTVLSLGTNEALSIDGKGTGAINLNTASSTSGGVVIGNSGAPTAAAITATGKFTLTSQSATGMAVGRNGATNPVFTVDASTTSAADGVVVKGLAAGSGANIKATSSGTNTPLTLDAKGTGVLTLQSLIAVPAGGSAAASVLMSTTAALGIYFGSGAPTVSAATGSLYIRTDGSSTSTRLYVNTGTTTWTNVTTAA